MSVIQELKRIEREIIEFEKDLEQERRHQDSLTSTKAKASFGFDVLVGGVGLAAGIAGLGTPLSWIGFGASALGLGKAAATPFIQMRRLQSSRSRVKLIRKKLELKKHTLRQIRRDLDSKQD